MSAHTVKIQIRTTLIVMLMLLYLQLKATFGRSLSNRVALLRRLVLNRESTENRPLTYLADQTNKDQSDHLNSVRTIPPSQLLINPADFFLHLK